MKIVIAGGDAEAEYIEYNLVYAIFIGAEVMETIKLNDLLNIDINSDDFKLAASL